VPPPPGPWWGPATPGCASLAGVPAAELKELHGMGPKALRILQEELEAAGQSLG